MTGGSGGPGPSAGVRAKGNATAFDSVLSSALEQDGASSRAAAAVGAAKRMPDEPAAGEGQSQGDDRDRARSAAGEEAALPWLGVAVVDARLEPVSAPVAAADNGVAGLADDAAAVLGAGWPSLGSGVMAAPEDGQGVHDGVPRADVVTEAVPRTFWMGSGQPWPGTPGVSERPGPVDTVTTASPGVGHEASADAGAVQPAAAWPVGWPQVTDVSGADDGKGHLDPEARPPAARRLVAPAENVPASGMPLADGEPRGLTEATVRMSLSPAASSRSSDVVAAGSPDGAVGAVWADADAPGGATGSGRGVALGGTFELTADPSAESAGFAHSGTHGLPPVLSWRETATGVEDVYGTAEETGVAVQDGAELASALDAAAVNRQASGPASDVAAAVRHVVSEPDARQSWTAASADEGEAGHSGTQPEAEDETPYLGGSVQRSAGGTDNPASAAFGGVSQRDGRSGREALAADHGAGRQGAVSAANPQVGGSVAEAGGFLATDAGAAAAYVGATAVETGSPAWSSTRGAELRDTVLQQLSEPLDEMVAELVRTPARSGVEEVSIRLRPEILGEVVMRIAVDADGAVTARFFVQHALVRQMIEQELPELRATLSQHGLQLADAGVFGGEDGLPWEDHPAAYEASPWAGPAYGTEPRAEGPDEAPALVARESLAAGGIDIRI